MKIQKSQLKTLIKGIVNEAITNEIFDGKHEQQMTPDQEKVVKLLSQRNFVVVKYVQGQEGIDVILERPHGKGSHSGPSWARVKHNGTINKDNLNVNKFLQIVGEMIANKDVEPDVYGAVNVGECSLSKGGNNIGFKPLGKYNKHPIYENIHEERPCPCGSGQMSHWETDGQGIPLCRACPKCRTEKLKRYRPEILKHYTQADVDEPIEPEDDSGLYEMGEPGEESKFKGKIVDKGSIKLGPGVPQDLADKIANYHWDIFGSENRDGVWHYKTRGNAYCCAVGMYQGKPSLLSKTTDSFKNELLVGEEEIFPKVSEQTGTGAVAGYSTPFAFSKKNKDGSKRALDVTQRMGYKKVKSISENSANGPRYTEALALAQYYFGHNDIDDVKITSTTPKGTKIFTVISKSNKEGNLLAVTEEGNWYFSETNGKRWLPSLPQ